MSNITNLSTSAPKTITGHELRILEKDCGTKSLSIKEKKGTLKNLHPEWFSHLDSIKKGGWN